MQALKGSMNMVKVLPLLMIAGFLAGCAGSPEPSPEAATPEESGCYQADNPAQTRSYSTQSRDDVTVRVKVDVLDQKGQN